MRMPSKSIVLLLATSAISTAASAHTGHGSHSLMQGLAHPIGADHLLAMLAVGVWSASALPAGKSWQGPASFMLALALGAMLGISGVTLPYLEHAIALSVVLFGAMLVLANKPVPKALGLGLIAIAASLHGLAHGAEAPEGGFAAYGFGFFLTTALLHIGGMGLGMGLRRLLAERRSVAFGGLGGLLGCAGLYLFSQV